MKYLTLLIALFSFSAMSGTFTTYPERFIWNTTSECYVLIVLEGNEYKFHYLPQLSKHFNVRVYRGSERVVVQCDYSGNFKSAYGRCTVHVPDSSYIEIN